MKKLFLNEDDAIVVTAQPAPAPAPQAPAAPEVELQQSAEALSASNMINQMIKGEWDAIDLYNSMALTFENMPNSSKIAETIRDIVKEEYIHVGQLEKVLQSINADADKIGEGSQEAESDLANAEVTEPVFQLEDK